MKNKRKNIIFKTSMIGIISNIFLVIFKSIVGLLSGSIAIIVDALNNLSDVLSSVITIIGTKLSLKDADKEHPYGHGRGEYITSFIVSIIILYFGGTAFIESFKKIIKPSEVKYDLIFIIILIVAIIVKLILSIYVIKNGKKANSTALLAAGIDAKNDALLSFSVLISSIVYLLFSIKIEAYVSLIISIYIIKTGYELIKVSIDNILENRVDSKLSNMIKEDINKEKEVLGSFDLILNNYGPDKYLGSVHIEVYDYLTVSDIDKISRKISKKILDKYGVILHTVGIYSINSKDKDIMKIQKDINKIVFSTNKVLQLHGFYLDKKEMNISFDIIIDNKYNKKDIYEDIYNKVKNKYIDYNINIVLDDDYSD